MRENYYLLFCDLAPAELERVLDEVLAAEGWTTTATHPAQRSFELVALKDEPAGVLVRGNVPLFDMLASSLSRRVGTVVVDPRDPRIDPCLAWIDGKQGDAKLQSKVLEREDDDEQLLEMPTTRTYYRRASVLPLPAQAQFRERIAAARSEGRADLVGLGKLRARPDGRISFTARQQLKNAFAARKLDPSGLPPEVVDAFAKLVESHEDVILCESAVLHAYEIPAGEMRAPDGELVPTGARIAVDLRMVE